MSDDELFRDFIDVVGTAARSDEHTVSYEIDPELNPGGSYVAIDGVRVSPIGFPIEMFTLNTGWEDHVGEDGLEKAREVTHDDS
ncbi:hypothetical protein [Halorubrum sp. Atlit-26R]|uniref:hypothetical protein n=1 Tax=Halorubrum sp. Atlit-26R TaxID=2282128 RepID=UPI0011C4599B|nr:hypothetical protein [Halorubrum sp. Atlit-26R]